MRNNKFIEEDWERMEDLDKLYLMEQERRIAYEWQMWEEEQERRKLPAKIEVVMPKVEKEEICKKK